MLKLVAPIALADLPIAEKKKLIGQRLQARRDRERQEALELQQLYSELFPGSKIGPMATPGEVEEVLRAGSDICSDGKIPNTQALFAEIGEKTGRSVRWAKVNAGAHIPVILKAVLPKLSNTALSQELEGGGMMTMLDTAEMCQHSPATYLKVAARHLGIVRQQRMTARALVKTAEKVQALEVRVLELEANGSGEEAWVAVAVGMRKAGQSWDSITQQVKRRRQTVIATVTAQLELGR